MTEEQQSVAAEPQPESPQQHADQAEPQQQQQQQQDAQPKLSKRQQKRQLKFERNQEAKKARKEAQKEEKQQALQQKRSAIDTMLEGMTEEQRTEWHEKNKEKKKQAAEARAAAKAKQQQALSAPQKLVIDLDFPGLMMPGELRSLCQQLSYSYSTAVNGEPQMHLHLLGATGDMEDAMHRQLPGHVHWSVTKSEKGFKEFFQDRLQDLVYLTADSPHELSVLDPSKVYILGGLVDRNRHKGICYSRAQAAGVATARLPISQHMKLHTSAVVTVNQVVDIMSRLQVNPDWRAALEAVLPGRKRADGGGGSREHSQEPAGGPAAAAATAAGGAAAAEDEADGEEVEAAAEAAGGEAEAAEGSEAQHEGDTAADGVAAEGAAADAEA